MQILNAIREHYLMKREADHGSQLFWDRIFPTRLAELQSFTLGPLQGSAARSGEDGEGSGEPCAAAVCAPGALHRHLRSLHTRA